jgi:hypothetical protein
MPHRPADEEPATLLEFVTAHTDLTLTRPPRPDPVDDRRAAERFEPTHRLTVRLDIEGEIWSARVQDITNRGACLQVDQEVAERIGGGRDALIWLESKQGAPIRLEGTLRCLPSRSSAADAPTPVAFMCGPCSLGHASIAPC